MFKKNARELKVYLQAGATENKAAELWRLQRQNAKH